ncbi:hypothetical protein B566_EDAN019337 [Ephemera danica]|nr:hypothetical protein B566_EDAN019337 [Ephemera danica]
MTDSPAAHWPERQRPPAGAPNVLVVLFDDVGFADFGCYGSAIRTPTIDAWAQAGQRLSGFHTTAMCSTTRAALLTGRNHHSVGMGCLANFDSGYPGYRGKISAQAPTLAERLRAVGYGTCMVGKWHVTPLSETGAAGPFDGWPLGRGFNRFYGFMDAETDHYAPELAAGELRTEAGFHTMISWSGLDIGLDRGSPVGHYEAPFTLQGARLFKVRVLLAPVQQLDGAAVGAAEMARQ